MSTIRERIFASLAISLEGIPNATVYRSRQTAVARSEGNAIVLEPEVEPIQKRTPLLALRDLTFKVIVLARGDIPDQVADPVILDAHAIIMADPTVGGLCAQLIEHSTEWLFDKADLTACEVTIRYTARYQTQTNDLTQPF